MESRTVFISLIKRRMGFEEVFGILMLNLHSQGCIQSIQLEFFVEENKKSKPIGRDSVVVVIVVTRSEDWFKIAA